MVEYNSEEEMQKIVNAKRVDERPVPKKTVVDEDIITMTEETFTALKDNIDAAANNLKRIEESLMYFHFSNTSAAEMSKYLVIMNDLHKCTDALSKISQIAASKSNAAKHIKT